MAGPWERFQAVAQDAGPWDKFKPKPQNWERAMLLPMETNTETGERRFAWPQVAVDIGNAMAAPGKAWNGEYDTVQIDPTTGQPEPFNRQMMSDAATLASIPAMGGTGAVTKEMAAEAAGGMMPQARSILLRALKDDQVPLGSIPQRLDDLGPDAVVADLGPRVQKQAQAIATMPGPGQKKVLDALRMRAAARDVRIMSDVDETLGKAPVPSAVKAGVKEGQTALSPYYQKAMASAGRVDTSPIALDLESIIVNERGDAQSVAKKVRGMLNVVGTDELDPSPQTLFAVRNAIDGLLETEQNSKAIAVLSGARKQVDELLGQAAPGVKEIDAMYAELARQKDAFETGQHVLRTGPEAPHPADVVEEMLSGALPKGQGVGPSAVPFRLSQGARADIDRLIGTTANDLLALKKAVGGEGDWNRAKLAAIFGAEKADNLLAIISRELRYKALEDDALAGSRTQVLKAAQDEIAGRPPTEGVVKSALNLKAGDAASAAADKGLGWISRANRERVNAAIADALMSKERERVARQLATGNLVPVGEVGTNSAVRETSAEREKYQDIVQALLGRR